MGFSGCYRFVYLCDGTNLKLNIMNGYIQCIDCGHEYPIHVLIDGMCGICRHYESECENTMGDFPPEFYEKIEQQSIAFKLVSRTFEMIGGTITDKEILYTKTALWNEAKQVAMFFVCELIRPENVVNSKVDFWKGVKEEINNL